MFFFNKSKYDYLFYLGILLYCMQENVGLIKNPRGCPALFKIDEENFIHPSPITPLAHEHVFAWISERPPKNEKCFRFKPGNVLF